MMNEEALTLPDQLDAAIMHLPSLRFVAFIAVPDLERGAVSRSWVLAQVEIEGWMSSNVEDL